MGRIKVLLLAAICFISSTRGSLSIDKIGNKAVKVIVCNFCSSTFNPSGKEYCCDDYCCDLLQYLTTGNRLIILIVVVVILSLCGCCLCCFFCRRRNSAPGDIRGFQPTFAYSSGNIPHLELVQRR